MNNFTFYNNTRIEFGRQSIRKLTGLTASYKKILLVYGGGSIKKNGVYEQVTEALKHTDVHEFSGILPNPEGALEPSLTDFIAFTSRVESPEKKRDLKI